MDRYLNRVLGERYEIQELIGVGGMALVYKAYDRVDDRTVAVKILKDEYLANEEFRLRFKNESKVISVLSHPNIVKVYDVCFGETLQYIVMEHVEGITLKEYIQNKKVLDWKEAVHFTIQMLRALQHAHDKGIIHRDIKPQNILLLQNNNIKVTDFGIARFSRSDIKPVAESGAIGSVHYVSPEQVRGEYTDGRSDIYSVGVVLYEMLTGKLPFESDCDENVAIMQMQQDAEKPSDINSEIPIGLEQITLKAMQKNPADRYQSAAEFLLDLDEFKNNPLVKFDYSYFIDKNPTKYIDNTMPLPGAPVKIDDEEDDAETEDTEEADGEGDEAPRNMTVPILAGIAISLVLIVGVIMVIAFADPIKTMFGGNSSQSGQNESFFSKLDVFGWFSGDKIEVPDFLNKNYTDVLAEYPDLIISNPPQYEYNSTYENGKVCDQSPAAGEKVSKDTVIQLTVASNGEMVLVKDVSGLNYIEAETALKSLGLNVECIPTLDTTKAENIVLYTEPSVNTYVANQGTVYVFYASQNEGINSARVPNTVGDELSIAKAKIVAAGLKVGAVTYSSSSPNLKDFVIGQTPSSMSSVKAGVYVNLVVGDGVPLTLTADFSITLPNLGSKATIKTYLNDNAYDIIPDVEMNGGSYQLSFTGSEAESTFKIYIDSSVYYSGNIDFSSDPPRFYDVITYNYSTKAYVPDVTNKTEAQARETLSASGFSNISVTTEYSDTVPAGLVMSQSPWSSAFTQYSVAVQVTLVISMGKDPSTTTMPPAENTTVPANEPTTLNEVTTAHVPTEPVIEPTTASHTSNP